MDTKSPERTYDETPAAPERAAGVGTTRTQKALTLAAAVAFAAALVVLASAVVVWRQATEREARVFGASTGRMFVHVLVPLLAPGILAASLLVLVRTIALFELTFLTAGSDSQTLVVAIYYAVFAAGVRAPQSVDAMAMIYMAVTLAWLLIALRFVNPTQLVSRVKEHPQTAE